MRPEPHNANLATACFVPLELPIESARKSTKGERFGFDNVPRLAGALREGNADAFRFLHDEWNHRILRYCFVLTAGDEAFATEVAQATYLRIFKQLRPLPDEAALWNWITCAMRSAAIDLRRVGGRYHRALARFADWLRLGTREAPAVRSETHLLGTLDETLSELEPSDRELIELRYFQREPLESIAARDGVTARAIEGRLARIRARLRTSITAALRKENS